MFIKRSVCTSLFLIFLSICSAGLFISCENHDEDFQQKIEIGKSFYYWETTAESSLPDAINHSEAFKKLDDYSTQNLRNVLGKGPHYVWIKADFVIPKEFRGQALGLVIPSLRFAARLYCNGVFISSYGGFPPNEKSNLFKAFFFSFPLSILNQTGVNTIYIKVYTQGRDGISSHSFIQPGQYAYPAYEKINFNHTRIYTFLEGMLIFTFILFLTLFLNMRSQKEYRDFAIINILTVIFIVPFFAPELPLYVYGNVSYTWLIKCAFCITTYLGIYFATSFAINFLHYKHSRWLEIFRLTIAVFQVALTIFMPTYESLITISPYMMGLGIFQASIGAWYVIKSLWNNAKRRPAIQFIVGFFPLILTVAFDLALRIHDGTRTYTYFSVFGWQFSIAIFLIILAAKFTHLYRRNEHLTNHLQEEVDLRTRDLQGANHELAVLNERLEKEKFRADLDLQMASIVQQRFFPQPNKHLKGWELAIYYNSQAIVSGDLYDYYAENGILNGLSLFDVSGHGLSAGLVTMPSKNIIGHAFQKGLQNGDPMDKILAKINNVMLYEKGEIDNYLTGLLCRFDNNYETGKVHVELGNAGHPYPLKYTAADDVVSEVTGNDGKKHYGAIGMKGIEISFATACFDMEEGDILICFTDGLTETSNKNQEQFGKNSISKIVKENSKKSASEMLNLITKALWNFTRGKPFEDDITIIIAKRTDMNAFVSEENDEPGEDVAELLPADE